MTEGERRWREGQTISWQGVNPYTIVQLVGEAGNIHISETGRYHVYWHRQRPDGQVTLAHHGGREGFVGLKAVMHQHERVILRYTGMVVTLPLEQQGEIPEEERRNGTPALGSDFPGLVAQLEQLRLPGEQQLLREWIGVLQDVSQELPTVINHGQLSQIRERLGSLLTEKKLVRSSNQYKQAAVRSLSTTGTRGGLLLGVNQAQLLLLRRAEQTVAITLGTMKRYNDLERLQISWNGVVDKLPGIAGQVVKALQRSTLAHDDILERAVNTNIFHETFSLEAQLGHIKGEPYFSHAQKFIEALSPVKMQWEGRDHQAMLRVLTEQVSEMEIWRRRVKEDYEGVGFGRYNLA